MKYLHLFEDLPEFNDYVNSEYYEEPFVGLTEKDDSGNTINKIDYNKPASHDYSQDYLTFEITSDGYINWYFNDLFDDDEYSGKTIEYSKNNGEWTEITASNEGTQINVVAGDIVRFRGNNSSYCDTVYKLEDNDYYQNTVNKFYYSTCGFKLYGNIMSMINSTNFANLTEFAEGTAYNFNELFSRCSGLTDASNLILPATILTSYCYTSMFYNCTSLVTAPSILPATTLAPYCYSNMFGQCTSLTTAPELPAITLAESCYNYMFMDCTSLNYVKCLATNISVEECTTDWLLGVAASGTFVKNPNMTSWTSGSNGIPTGWTIQNA